MYVQKHAQNQECMHNDTCYIVVTRLGVMYLICTNQGPIEGTYMAPKTTVNTNQIHHIPTLVTTNLYSYERQIAKKPLETSDSIHSV